MSRWTSRRPGALLANFPKYIQSRTNVVIGTTGWGEHAAKLRADAAQAGLGIVASANFSIGVNIFQHVVAETARMMQAQPQYGAWVHEIHHSAKRDAPSGTAIQLRDAMKAAGFERPIDMSSSRAGTDSRHAHDRIRRSIGYDRVDPHGARPSRVCGRRARRRAVDHRDAPAGFRCRTYLGV